MVSPAAVASIVTGPARTAVIVLVATPLAAVALPVPLTVPAPDCLVKATMVELSAVTVLPAASWIVAVSTRFEPEVRLAVEPVSWIWVAAPWTTVKAPSVPVVRPADVASIVTEPASTPVIVLVATPLEAVALPVPLTVPAPEALAKATTVELSAVTVLPAASWIVAVSTRVVPEVRSAVEPVSWICVAAPWTTVKAPSVPVVSPAEVASIVTEPTSAPVIVFDAIPLDAVALPVPVTVPAPDAFANATTVELSDVTVLPAASWIVAVSTRVAPEVRSAVAPESAIWVAAPWTTVKAPRVPVVSPPAVASIVTEPTRHAGDGLGGDAAGGGRAARSADGACTRGLGEGDDGGAVGGDGVAGGVLDRGRQQAGRAGGEVGRRACERDLGGGAVDDGEGSERAGRQTCRGRFDRHGADELTGDRLRRDTCGSGGVASAC